jgi:hypothetical protein
MKNFIITISFALISFFVKGQNYTPFDLSNGQWDCGYFTKGGYFDSYGNDYVREEVRFNFGGDTLIDDAIYKKIFYVGYAKPTMSSERNISGYIAAIRNDSINKKVWIKHKLGYDIEFDFNIEIGDLFLYSCSEPEAIIYSIDSVLYCDRFHKRFNFRDFYNNDQFLTEGIGSNLGLLPVNCLTSYSYLICYSEKNNTICDTCQIPTDIIETEVSKIKIYPNPTNDVLRINAETTITSIRVLDLYGRILYENSRIDDKEAEIKVQQNGILVIEIKTSNSIVIRKFIKK